MKGLYTIMLCLLISEVTAQVMTVFDKRHFFIVTENAAKRQTSELAYQQSLDNIKRNTADIALNMSSLSLVETMIYRSLAEVNEALKNGIQVRQISKLVQAIHDNSTDAMQMAENDPVLLLFIEEYVQKAREKGVALVSEVASFILAEGKNILINYNVRDELLTGVLKELWVIHGYMHTIKQSMYWVKLSGIIKSLNPYQQAINQDLALINQILINKRILER